MTGAATTGGGSGATLGFTRDGDTFVARLYAYRPIAGESPPVAEPNVPPFRTLTAVALHVDGHDVQPPFALFFSVSGHASALAGFVVNAMPPPAREPACPLETGIVLSFDDSRQIQTYAMSCEMAQLELETTPSVAPAAATRREL